MTNQEFAKKFLHDLGQFLVAWTQEDIRQLPEEEREEQFVNIKDACDMFGRSRRRTEQIIATMIDLGLIKAGTPVGTSKVWSRTDFELATQQIKKKHPAWLR